MELELASASWLGTLLLNMKSIELFAGAGGLALGIKKAGFAHEAVIERDADACATIRFNLATAKRHMGQWPLHEVDARAFNYRQFEDKVDLVSGGPPCQPFSIGGKHRGQKDNRDMFPTAASVVRITRPKAFIFENVRGLLRRSFAKYFEYVLLQLTYPEVVPDESKDWTEHLARLESHHTQGSGKGLFYRVVFQPLNAADFGVPQKRERVVIVGFRSDVMQDWAFPRRTHSEEALLLSQWKSGEYWNEHRVARRQRPECPAGLQARLERLSPAPGMERWRTVRDTIADLPEPSDGPVERVSNHRFQPGARSYPGHTGSPLDEPAKTLKAGDHGVPGGENMLAKPDGSVRYFTVRESARLQTFPDWFAFPGSWSENMRQIGNAVPVCLAEKVAASVAAALERGERRAQRGN